MYTISYIHKHKQNIVFRYWWLRNFQTTFLFFSRIQDIIFQLNWSLNQYNDDNDDVVQWTWWNSKDKMLDKMHIQHVYMYIYVEHTWHLCAVSDIFDIMQLKSSAQMYTYILPCFSVLTGIFRMSELFFKKKFCISYNMYKMHYLQIISVVHSLDNELHVVR